MRSQRLGKVIWGATYTSTVGGTGTLVCVQNRRVHRGGKYTRVQRTMYLHTRGRTACVYLAIIFTESIDTEAPPSSALGSPPKPVALAIATDPEKRGAGATRR